MRLLLYGATGTLGQRILAEVDQPRYRRQRFTVAY